MPMMKPMDVLSPKEKLIAQKVFKDKINCLNDDNRMPLKSLYDEYRASDLFAKGGSTKPKSMMVTVVDNLSTYGLQIGRVY